MRDPLPSVKTAFAIISREESHRCGSSTSKTSTVAFNSKFSDNKKKNWRNPNPNLKCTHCNMIGHTVDRCYELVGYPPGHKKKQSGQNDLKNSSNNGQSFQRSNLNHSKSNNVSANSEFPFSNDQIAKLLALVGDKSTEEPIQSNMAGDLMLKRVLMTGKEVDGLYLVEDMTPSSVLLGRSPYEIVFGYKPSLNHLRNFGCLCFSTILNNHDKFGTRAEKCVFLGYSNEKKGYKLWSLDHKIVFYSRDVKFYETIYPFKSSSLHKNVQTHTSLNHLNFFDLENRIHKDDLNAPNDEEKVIEGSSVHDDGNSSSPPVNTDCDTDNLVNSDTTSADTMPSETISANNGGRTDETHETEYEMRSTSPKGQSESVNEYSGVRRTLRKSNLPRNLSDYVVEGKVKYGVERVVNYSLLSPENFCFISNLDKTIEPKSFKEAVKDPNWVQAMNDEMEALNRNGTWVLTDLPQGRKPIGCKWIYKVKYKSNGQIDRYKARLVAKGYSQREGIDFDETFSPVVKMVTVRCIINLAINNGWSLYQLDVNNAFLYGNLSEDVYMSLPEGYFSQNETKVCKLVKSLYGLKQAPRNWNEKLTSTLLEIGFVQSISDYSLFVKNDSNVFIALLVYVDDIVITGNNKAEIESVKSFLNSKFMIKDLGELKFFLGIEVTKHKDVLYLSQRKYCLDLLSEFGMLGSKPVSTPIEQNVVIFDKDSTLPGDDLLENVSEYQRLVGKLIYITLTRPDISYAVQCLSQYMHSPLKSHLQLAFRVLRYLKQSPGQGLSFSKGNLFYLKCYVDSDWAKCKVTRRSVTGFSIFWSGNLISWKSKKQSVVSRSTAEAEYRAMCDVTCEVMWLQNILKELHVNITLPIELFCDNSAALSIAANPVFHDRTKHFEIDLHFIREKITSGIVQTKKIDTSKQVADIFTKGLGSEQHKFLCKQLGLTSVFAT
ncbi:putative RNA-directed DNA polymerase [Helianthus annuus]|nr:putative RNA-directed DNA polymerase [Helianthus annuus]